MQMILHITRRLVKRNMQIFLHVKDVPQMGGGRIDLRRRGVGVGGVRETRHKLSCMVRFTHPTRGTSGRQNAWRQSLFQQCDHLGRFDFLRAEVQASVASETLTED